MRVPGNPASALTGHWSGREGHWSGIRELAVLCYPYPAKTCRACRRFTVAALIDLGLGKSGASKHAAFRLQSAPLIPPTAAGRSTARECRPGRASTAGRDVGYPRPSRTKPLVKGSPRECTPTGQGNDFMTDEGSRAILRGHCPNCGADRNAEVLAEDTVEDEDKAIGIWGRSTYSILRSRMRHSIHPTSPSML